MLLLVSSSHGEEGVSPKCDCRQSAHRRDERRIRYKEKDTEEWHNSIEVKTVMVD